MKEIEKRAQAPVVEVQNGQPVTTTLEVARYFGKRHKNVLQAIETLLPQLPEINRLNFQPVDYTDAKGENRPTYLLTRDGFILLAMGFTGQKALQFKVAYIDAFNAMEAEIQKDRQWVSGLSESLERICPTPVREETTVRNQRAVKLLRAMAAYWALLEDMPQETAEKAVCAVGMLRELDDFDFDKHLLDPMYCFLEQVIARPSSKDGRPATEQQIDTIEHLLDACAQYKYSRDRNVYDLLKCEYGITTEDILKSNAGQARRIAGLAYNLLCRHETLTMVIDKIKSRAGDAIRKNQIERKP